MAAQPTAGPSGAIGSAVPTSGRIGRFYREPIGPPSNSISLNASHDGTSTGWVTQAQEALQRLETELDRITGGPRVAEEEDLGRCDVSDLSQEVSKWHDNLYYREELKKWTETRIYYKSSEADEVKNEGSVNGAREGTEETGGDEVTGGGPAAKKRQLAAAKKGKAKGKGKEKENEGDQAQDQDKDADDEEFVLDAEVREFAKEADDKTLATLKPWDAEFYQRKTKTADVNCLPEIRPTLAPVPDAAPLDNSIDPFSNVLLTITFHPISKIHRKIHTSPQQQTLVCLASNTLGELRDNLTAGGDSIPKELEPSQAPHDNGDAEEEGSDAESRQEEEQVGQFGIGEMDEMGTIASATRKRITGHFGDGEHPTYSESGKKLDQDGKEIIEWSKERRVTGACFAVDGVFYPDLKGDGKTDYAQMLLEAIDNTKWSHKNGKKFSARRPPRIRDHSGSEEEEDEDEDDEEGSDNDSASSVASPVNPRSNDISVHSTPAPPEFDDHNIDPVLREGYNGGEDAEMTEAAVIIDEEEGSEPKEPPKDDPNKPKFVAGTPMHETKLGDIPLKVGQPYWFVHQGNYEHVWTIDSIRWRHPSDPPLTAPSSNHPYPLTTYLSRQLSYKCHICDRDPATLFLLNDFSASENPSYVCQACFDCLHPEIPSKRDLERAKRKEERKEEKRLAKEERKKALIREQRKYKRKNKPKDDDSAGSNSENERAQMPQLPDEEEESEESEEEDSGVDEVRERKYMDGVRVIPTVIER